MLRDGVWYSFLIGLVKRLSENSHQAVGPISPKAAGWRVVHHEWQGVTGFCILYPVCRKAFLKGLTLAGNGLAVVSGERNTAS